MRNSMQRRRQGSLLEKYSETMTAGLYRFLWAAMCSKVSGGGQNFVHGGASLQEIIVPVIDIKTSKYHTETRSAGIALIGSLSKIANLTTNLDFIQTEAVSDVNKETTYKIFFISGDNEKISNDKHICSGQKVG